MHLAGPLQSVWSAISKCDGEFEIISKFSAARAAASGATVSTGTSAALFERISQEACSLYEYSISKLIFVQSGENALYVNSVEEEKNDELPKDNIALAKRGLGLFHYDSDEILSILRIPRHQHNSSFETGYTHNKYGANVDPRILAALNISMSQSAPSFINSVICRPLRGVVRLLSQSAASTMISSLGFNILRHMEYLKLLFLMGSETVSTDLESRAAGATATKEATASSSPASIHIMLIEAFRTVFRKSVTSQYKSNISSSDSVSSAKLSVSKTNRVGNSAVLSYDTEFFSLGQTMTFHLSQSLPKSAQLTEMGSNFLSGSGIGVSVAFRSQPVTSKAESSQQQQLDGQGLGAYSEERCPSGYWAQQMINSLSIELQYPFPFNKVITREYLLRLHKALRCLLSIALMKSAIEELWKQDRVSRKQLLDLVSVHKAPADAAMLISSLERCRASRTWLLHTVKGLQYHVLSAIHESLWSAFMEDMRERGMDSVQQQRKAFEKYVDDVDLWIRLSQRETEVIIEKGHLAISSFYSAIVAANEICLLVQKQPKRQPNDISGSQNLLLSIGIGKCILSMKRADIEFVAVRSAVSQLISDIDDNAGAFVLRQQSRRTGSTVSAASNHAKKLSTVLGGASSSSWRQSSAI